MSLWPIIEQHRNLISQNLEPYDPSGVFRALWLTQHRPDRGEEFFRVLGFVHLIRSSGIHFLALYITVRTMIMHLGQVAQGLGLRGSPSVYLWVARVCSCLTMFYAWALAGGRWGLLRPLLIIALRAFVRRWGGAWDRYAPLIAALVLEAAIEVLHRALGHEASGLGRWHYALAVGGGLAGWQWTEGRPMFQRHLAMALSSWLWTVPADVMENHWIQWATPALSLLSIPVFASFLFPLGLLIFVLNSPLAWTAFGPILEISNQILFLVSQCALRVPTLWVGSPKAFVVAMILALPISRIRIHRVWPLGILWVAVCVYLTHGWPPQRASGFEVTQVNVGQGDATWIKGEKSGLIDVGSRRGKTWVRWMQWLAREEVTQLDFVALTHGDEDHRGALPYLEMLLPVRCVVAHPSVKLNLLNTLRLKTLWREPGQGCEPFRAWVLPDWGRGGNRHMLAYQVPLRGTDRYYLNAGDASLVQELALIRGLRKWGDLSKIEIWKLSHHGSKFSTPSSVPDLTPSEVWISSGKFNRYGHPSPDAIDRVLAWKNQAKGPKLRRTDREGDIRKTDAKH